MNKDGGPAFPSHGSMGEVAQQGMSLRDYFAAAALNGMYAGSSCTTDGDIGGYADAAYAIADAMIAERDKVKE